LGSSCLHSCKKQRDHISIAMQLRRAAVIALVVAAWPPAAAFVNQRQVQAQVQVQVHGKVGYMVNLSSPAPQDHDITPKDYEQAYNHLYDNCGYHANKEFTHEGQIVQKVVDYRKMLPPGAPALHKVVVLGCSHGKGAQLLHGHGFEVYGIDVASRAIEMANNRDGEKTCGPSTEPCFVQGSLVKLPYDDDGFDAGVSADVLEHISPEDVPQVVKEISRVVRHYLFVQIAAFKERAKNGEKAGMANLHLTIKGPEWWKSAFAEGGWKVTGDSSDAKYVNLTMEKEK